ncbi:MAG: fused NADH-quinone oxidoreductase subunit E/endonuclease, partial [Rhodobacteraceae bacterium]|nr:fused NADH-quinone oxidoreductase subunit E/endonuclease [Paracoccaceae bacterium]
QPALEYVADMLSMDYIRVLEVATFYFMFQLQPVGSVAHFQICGTLSCMIMGSEDLMEICKTRIAPKAHELSEDGRFSWEEVECLGACTNAPMAQIGKDYYEDLTPESFIALLDEFEDGKVPVAGPQNGRYAGEPLSGLTALTAHESGRTQYNASVQRSVDVGDGIKRIDGTEVPLSAPWQGKAGASKPKAKKPAAKKPAAKTDASAGKKPRVMKGPRKSGADDLKKIKGVGPKLEAMLHKLGFFHFDQIAKWSADEIAWVDENLEGFSGRVSRDGWVDQASTLAEGGETEFSKKVGKGSVY